MKLFISYQVINSPTTYDGTPLAKSKWCVLKVSSFPYNEEEILDLQERVIRHEGGNAVIQNFIKLDT